MEEMWKRKRMVEEGVGAAKKSRKIDRSPKSEEGVGMKEMLMSIRDEIRESTRAKDGRNNNAGGKESEGGDGGKGRRWKVEKESMEETLKKMEEGLKEEERRGKKIEEIERKIEYLRRPIGTGGEKVQLK